jgi:ABC-type Fe3+ transport system permease subunit
VESLRKPQNSPWIDRALLGLVGSCTVVPFLFFAIEALFGLEGASLTAIFFKLLGRAFIFGISQAFLSALFSIGFAFVVALSLLSLRNGPRQKLAALIRALGQSLFVLPGTAIALLVLSLSATLREAAGAWTLIIAAHALWSSLFIASHVFERLEAWFDSEGADLMRAARSFGAPSLASLKCVVAPLLLQETRTWFPLIFLWSFGAFSTVFLLGSGPQHSTPEVLLYYTLMNDVDTSRLLVLFVLNLASGVVLLRLTSDPKASLSSGRLLPSQDSERSTQNEILHLPARATLQALSAALVVGVCGLLVVQVFGILKGGLPDAAIWKGLASSLGYAVLVSAVSLGLMLWTSRASSRSRQALSYLLAVSPVLLAASWSHFAFMGEAQRPLLVSYFVCALGLSLLQIPFAALWIERSLSAMNPDLELYARSAGLSDSQIFWSLRVPYLRPIFEKLLSYVFCIALGEIALASIWLRESPPLALAAKRLTQSYDFQSAAWIFVLTFVAALLSRRLFRAVLRRVFV